MFTGTDAQFELRERMMMHVIRDEDTDEIIGIDPNAPDDEKAEFEKMMAEMESYEPIDK